MKRFVHMVFVVGSLIIWLTARVGSAQTGGAFDLTWSAITGTGQTAARAGNYELIGTIGEPHSGTLGGEDYAVSAGFWAPPGPIAVPAPACVGDCNGDGQVTVNELIAMVNIALGNADISTCTAGDASSDGEITVNEIVAGVSNALNGCPPG